MITLIIIVFTFGYYYLFYTTHREQLFKEKGFRIIERVGDNVSKKYQIYKNIVTNVIPSVDDKMIKAKIQNFDSIHLQLKAYSFPGAIKVDSVHYQSSTGKPRQTMVKAGIGLEDVTFSCRHYPPDLEEGFDIYLKYDIEELFHTTLRYGFFDKYLAFTKDAILYHDIPVSNNENYYGSLQQDSINLFSTAIHKLRFDAKNYLVFIVPVNLDETTVYIGGMVEEESLSRASWELPPLAYTIIAFLFVILVLSLPYLRLIMISASERLNPLDALVTFVAKVLGATLLGILVLYYVMQFGKDHTNQQQFLQNNADLIEESLQAEIKQINDQIDYNEKLLASGNYSKVENSRYPYDSYISDKGQKNYYQNYQAITWMNSRAEQLIKWNVSNITPRVSVPHRDYFKMVNEKRLWDDKNYSGNPFYFGSIYSITEGKHYVVVSKESNTGRHFPELSAITGTDDSLLNKPTVVMVSAELQFFKNLVLPENVSWVILDDEGQVILAKNKSKILQENLIRELNTHPVLIETMITGKDSTFIEDYDTRNRLFYVRTMGNLPVYLITYLDYRLERIVDIQILGMTSLLYSLMFILIIIQLLVFLYINYDFKRKTKGHNLFFKWFWPTEAKTINYLLLFLLFASSILLYFLSDCHNQLLSTYGYFSLLITTALLILRNYNLQELRHRWPHFLFFVFSFLIGLILLLVPAHQGNHLTWGNYVFLFLCLAAILLNFTYRNLMSDFQRKIRLRSIYNFSVFMLVLSMGMVPAISFYKHAYLFEKNNYLRNLQLNLLQQVDEKSSAGAMQKNENLQLNKALNVTGRKADCRDIKKNISGSGKPENNVAVHSAAELEFLSGIRFRLDQEEELYTLSALEDEQHGVFIREDKENILLNYKGHEVCSARYKFSIIDSLGEFRGAYSFLLPLIFAFVILYGLYRLVIFWTGRIFLLGTLPEAPEYQTDILEHPGNSIVICPSFSKALKLIKEIYQDSFILINLNRFAEDASIPYYINLIKSEKPKSIIISDFEGAEPTVLKWKIKFLLIYNEMRYTGQIDNSKVIILVPRVQVTEIAGKDMELHEHLKRYMELISEYKVGYIRVDKLSGEGELGLSDYERLHDMEKEDRILLDQSVNELYYRSIWNNCDQYEQFLIYDLAQDGLLNLNNLPDIYKLMHKGVFIAKDGRVQLFSESFQNFVLTLIDGDDLLEIEKKAKAGGQWSSYQFPIVMVIFSLLIFLLITQQSVFNYMIGWFTAALGAIPVLMRVVVGLSGLKLLKLGKPGA